MNAVDRRVGAVIGLAIGDAAGWPARQHRSHLLPPWTRRLRRELDTFAEEQAVTTLAVPFALNQEPAPLRLGPSDDAEWAAWTVTWLAAAGPDVSRDGVHEVWTAVATQRTLPRGRISITAAADGLRRGVRPPVTGHDNPHHFDDAAAVRAVAIGAVAADPARTVDVAGWDAEVTNGDDGIAAARAVARAVAAAVAGGGGHGPALPELMLDELPADGLIGRTARSALTVVADASSPAEAVPLLDDLLDRVYSYGTAAAQTVPVALALADVAVRGDAAPIEAVTAAACLTSLADSAPALTGALLGAVHGAGAFPESWVQRCRTLAGCCAPSLAGTDLIELVETWGRPPGRLFGRSPGGTG